MSVAAAALIAGIGIAAAQAPLSQQSAPAEKSGPAMKETTGQALPESAKPSQKAGESKADKMDKGAQAPAPATRSTTGQAPAPGATSKPTAGQAETTSPGKTSTDMKADTKARTDAKTDAEFSGAEGP